MGFWLNSENEEKVNLEKGSVPVGSAILNSFTPSSLGFIQLPNITQMNAIQIPKVHKFD